MANEIVIRFELQDARFCNESLDSTQFADCPCLKSDDLYGEPESCNMGYDIKIKYYNAKKGELKDNLGIKRYSGYPYGYEKVAIRPAACVADLVEGDGVVGSLDMEKMRTVLRGALCSVGHLNVIDEDVVDDLAHAMLEIFGVSQV